MPIALLLAGALAASAPHAAETGDLSRLRAQAARVSIVRDSWGIAHVYGRTDADAVFGMAYAQAEDDFPRVEVNYLTALGRMAEAEGEARLWQDLRARLYIDPDDLKARYAAAPAWLRRLMDGWAGGLNLYLATHPKVHPMVLTRFEPWMALSFTEGSIGGDIEKIDLKALRQFYDHPTLSRAAGEVARPKAVTEGALRAQRRRELAPSVRFAATSPAARERSKSADDPFWKEPSGSNGIAIAPKLTRDGHALLLINPHTSFYFRAELQVTSDEGLDAYGAATWGQPFIYQGFNRHMGWMHTTSGVDAVDEFSETLMFGRTGPVTYMHAGKARDFGRRRVTLAYRGPSGGRLTRSFEILRTAHGPVVREGGRGQVVAVAMMYRPVEALEQSFLRTKAGSVAAFRAVSDRLKANSSNNTLLADDAGHVAYLHPQFVPRRDHRFDYARPVDGSDPAVDWRGDTPAWQAPHMLDPPSGFVFNVNDAPWNVAGKDTLKAADFPKYMDTAGSSPRTEHALEVLTGHVGFTPESLRAAAYDSHLPAFDHMLPPLLADLDALPASDPHRARLAEPAAVLRAWNRRWAADSVATSLAVFYGEALWKAAAPAARAARLPPIDWMSTRAAPEQRLAALDAAVAKLTAEFGAWRTPWGEINRFQRLDDAIAPHFDDARPSIPVPFASAQWGSLASFGLAPDQPTKRRYGSSGNSFVAVVEFGPRVRAMAVTAGGESGHPASPHFADQATRYASGALREVWFHTDQVKAHAVRTYRPGD